MLSARHAQPGHHHDDPTLSASCLGAAVRLDDRDVLAGVHRLQAAHVVKRHRPDVARARHADFAFARYGRRTEPDRYRLAVGPEGDLARAHDIARPWLWSRR